jgi:hypothetical protein
MDLQRKAQPFCTFIFAWEKGKNEIENPYENNVSSRRSQSFFRESGSPEVPKKGFFLRVNRFGKPAAF